MEKLLLTVEETRQHLGGKGRGYVYQLLANNQIDSVKLGKSRLIVSESLERFVDSLTSENKEGL
jgi:excisionase family DNA binding protein